MEPIPSPPPDTPRQAKRRRWALIAAIGVVATALLVGLVVAVAGDRDGEDHAAPVTTEPDERAADTTTEEPSTSGTRTTEGGPTTTSMPPRPARSSTFDDGRWTVGRDIQPGRYIAAGIDGNRCDWARLADATDDSVIAAETNVANQAIVDILSSDAAFHSTGCGTWARYTGPDPPPSTTIDQGDWVVGEQIEPGTYRVPQAAICAWTRATGFEHTDEEITQTQDTNIALEGPFLVTLTTGERFTTQGCDTWIKAD